MTTRDFNAQGKVASSMRKVFVELSLALSEWESTHSTSEKIFNSLVNASQRRTDFANSRGNLGVLSNFVDSEKILQECDHNESDDT